MPRCPFCSQPYLVSNSFTCTACGADFRGSEVAEVGGEPSAKPAHRALLDGAKPAISVSREAPPKLPTSDVSSKRPRLVSTAGPSLPIPRDEADSAPTGWMARLEAARTITQKPAAAQSTPPAAPAGPQQAIASPVAEVFVRPAHLLVARLEEEEQQKREVRAQRVAQLFEGEKSDEIAAIEVVPQNTERPARRRIPGWILAVSALAVAAGILAAVYTIVHDEPEPRVVVDPKLERAKRDRETAMKALDEGHRSTVEGRTDDAIRAYEKALALEPSLAAAERGLGVCFTKKGDKAVAVKHFRRYLELMPTAKDADEVRDNIARYEKSSGDTRP